MILMASFLHVALSKASFTSPHTPLSNIQHLLQSASGSEVTAHGEGEEDVRADLPSHHVFIQKLLRQTGLAVRHQVDENKH